MTTGKANAFASKDVYIFLGPELGKKQDAIKVIKEKLINTSASVEEHIFYPGETNMSEIADILLNISLFSDARMVIVKNAEQIKKKDEIELLASCIKNMDEKTALIILSDETKLTSGFDDAFFGAGVSKANHRIFYEMFEGEKTKWLENFFNREGVKINRDAINTILELVENNTDALKRECSRLIGFLQNDRKTTSLAKGQVNNMSLCREDIEKWLSHNRDESAFTLFSRIAVGDLSKALESVSVMLAAKESSQGILAGLTWCFRKLGDYLFLIETGNAGNSFELKKIGLSSPKAKDEYAAAASRYNTESVETCLALTAEYEMLLRSPAAALENILMDRYILAVINTGKKTGKSIYS